jgi:hypothetical protein
VTPRSETQIALARRPARHPTKIDISRGTALGSGRLNDSVVFSEVGMSAELVAEILGAFVQVAGAVALLIAARKAPVVEFAEDDPRARLLGRRE